MAVRCCVPCLGFFTCKKKGGAGLNHPLLGRDSVILLLSQLARLIFQRWPALAPWNTLPLSLLLVRRCQEHSTRRKKGVTFY